MQRLELVDDKFPDLLKGIKTNTLRWCEGEIKTGYLVFYATNNADQKALVWVTHVQNTPMNKIAYKYDMGGKELYAAMLRHYPNIQIDSEVSYIEYLSPLETLNQKGIPDNLCEEVITDFV